MSNITEATTKTFTMPVKIDGLLYADCIEMGTQKTTAGPNVQLTYSSTTQLKFYTPMGYGVRVLVVATF